MLLRIDITMKIFVFFTLVAGAFAQFESSGKSIDAPQPGLVQMPYHQPSYSAPAAQIVGGSQTNIHIGAPTIAVPKRLEQVVDVPHSPLQLPQGGHQIEDVHYDIPQPVVYMPKPVIQRKPVVFNVPQPIVQVPQPIIRHKPILYTVNPIIKMSRPLIRHNLEHYNVAPAAVHKSGYGAAQPAVVVQQVHAGAGFGFAGYGKG